MKTFTENTFREGTTGRGVPVPHEHRGFGHPLSPHERRTLMHIEFEDEDWTLMKEMFGDEDTAAAAANVLMDAPPEIQILAVQLIDIIKEVM